MNSSSPSEIYIIILREIKNLVNSLEKETTDDEIRKSQEDAQKQLEDIYNEVCFALKSLQMSAEWDVFSIAFYGETNAGKSTLIETLRILLREQTKEIERKEFKKIHDTMQDIQDQIDHLKNLLERAINDYQSRIIEIEENIRSLNLELVDVETNICILNENIHDIENQIIAKRRSSIINYVKSLLGLLKEQQEHKEIIEKITNCKTNNIFLNKEISRLENLNELILEERDTKAKNIKGSKEILDNEILQISAKLSEYCDGKIIGDGHSDFTQKVTTYHFDYGGQKFALLDLPGIEGKEDLVLNEIKEAVQKAHAVFYVSSKPTPPQTGNENNEGTLEKIKNHLGQQTEVYSIFNKRIKNFQQLQPGLINDDEKESLKELDKIMYDRLGDLYGKHIVLSAYPAFLSIANCSKNNFENAQKKFFEKFESKDNLLQASQVGNFCDWITVNMVKNCKTKIIRANYKKVSTALKQTSNKLNEVYKGLYDLEKKLIKNKRAVDNQLDEAAEILIRQLDSAAYKAVDDFKTFLRKNIYSDIDKVLNNDEFKSAFEFRTNEAIKLLSINLEGKFDENANEFKNDVASIIDKYHRYASELLNVYNNSSQFDFDFTPIMNIKSGISISSIIIGIGSAILFIMNPGGWVVLALSILGAVISIGKDVLGLLDHKYRASLQKKASDDNIERMGDKILKTVLANLKDSHDPLQEGIGVIKEELLKSINHIKSMNHVFRSARTKFELLNISVEEEVANLHGNN